jgi:DNA topoisomerase VI subunit A
MKKKDYAPVIKKIDEIAAKIYDDFKQQEIPSLQLPTRSKSNILFDERLNVWKYGKNRIQRSAKSLDGAYMLLRTMYMVDFIKEMIKIKKSSTLREMYYISEGWDLGKFHSQNESNLLAEDLEVVTSLLREDFKLRPEEDGARVIGNISIEEITRNNRKQTIHCQDDVGDSGYSIPYNVEPEKIAFKDVDVDFIIAIETGGMFDRLVENHFDEDYNALLVHLKGQPARSTRRFIQRLNSEYKAPVVVFTDCDPWSFRIFASVAYGAIKTAHISEYLATPSSSYLGVTPSDIENYDLPTDDLTKEDIKSLKSELSDPRFQDTFWKHEIKLQLKNGKKSEQQALAKYGLDYVTDTYLPEKLGQLGMISKK